MPWDFLAFIGTAVIALLQLWQAYMTSSLKFWVQKNFVAKDDMGTYLSPLKDSITVMRSEERLRSL